MRCLRILRTSSGFVITASTRISDPHLRHLSGSTSYILARSLVQAAWLPLADGPKSMSGGGAIDSGVPQESGCVFFQPAGARRRTCGFESHLPRVLEEYSP